MREQYMRSGEGKNGKGWLEGLAVNWNWKQKWNFEGIFEEVKWNWITYEAEARIVKDSRIGRVIQISIVFLRKPIQGSRYKQAKNLIQSNCNLIWFNLLRN
jgi:hypothetical protein